MEHAVSQSLFVASTGQNRGKTTICLGLFQALRRRFESVGFLKPVGQQYVTVENDVEVDKDAALFSSWFSLTDEPATMSPIVCDHGFTRRFLDRTIHPTDLERKLLTAYEAISEAHDFVLVEGSGHMGVGSIFSLNNARVASLLETPVVLVAKGGLGDSFDELALNITLARQQGADVRGIILNKVLFEKQAMIEEYFPKALAQFQIPLLGVIPYVPSLSFPTMHDFALLFETSLLSGKKEALHHIDRVKLVAASLESFLQDYEEAQLIITPSCREDIILACIERKLRAQFLENQKFFTSLLLTGSQEPNPEVVQKLDVADIPAIWVPECAFEVMKCISTFTAKIQKEDQKKIQQAIDLVEKHIDLEPLLKH